MVYFTDFVDLYGLKALVVHGVVPLEYERWDESQEEALAARRCAWIPRIPATTATMKMSPISRNASG